MLLSLIVTFAYDELFAGICEIFFFVVKGGEGRESYTDDDLWSEEEPNEIVCNPKNAAAHPCALL